MASIKDTEEPAVGPIVNLPPVSPPSPSDAESEWAMVPTRPSVRPLKYPTAPTKHMLVLTTRYFRGSVTPNVWNCFPRTENPLPRGPVERQEAIKRVFASAGAFFSERGIVLSSLNICCFGVPFPKNLELFFKDDAALWKADSLAEEFSAAFGDGILRRQENRGKMVIFGVHPDSFADFDYRTNLTEEHLRELEDLNPIFNSKKERITYRIRNVHYMSGLATNEKLAKHGSTWSVTFNDFRVPELFIEEGGFRFFSYEASGLPRWYEDRSGRWNTPYTGSQRGRTSSQASLRSGELANNGQHGESVQVQEEGMKPQEAVEMANGVKDKEAAAAVTNRRPKFGNASVIHPAGDGIGAAAVAVEQQSTAEVEDVGAAAAKEDPKADEVTRAEDAAKAAEAKLLKKRQNTKLRNQKKKEKVAAAKEAAKQASGGVAQGAVGAVGAVGVVADKEVSSAS